MKKQKAAQRKMRRSNVIKTQYEIAIIKLVMQELDSAGHIPGKLGLRLVMFAFDLLHVDGADVRRLPLIERREKLGKVIPMDPRGAIPFSDHHDGEGAELFKRACAKGSQLPILVERLMGSCNSRELLS